MSDAVAIMQKRIDDVLSMKCLNNRSKIKEQDTYLYGYLVAADDLGMISHREYEYLRDYIEIRIHNLLQACNKRRG
jgi:hypothetical protein